MDKGIRRKILNLIKNKLEEKMYFRKVIPAPPTGVFPLSHDCPAVFVTRAVENMEPLTNEHKESRFSVEIIAIVEDAEDLELSKADAEDVAEEAMMELQTETAFTDLADIIKVETADGTPAALAVLGIPALVLPPYGIIRLTAEILFKYEAI